MGLIKPSKVSAVKESDYGVCVWELVDDTGQFLGEGEKYLSLEGKLGDEVVEQRMRIAVRSYIGDRVEYGRPVWIPGHRKISDMEADDQMARFLDGKIPDEVDEAKQILNRGKQ